MKKIFLTAFVFALLVGAGIASANHSWGKYHWDISTEQSVANPLELGDNLTAGWGTYLATASTDWNLSVLKNEVVAGGSDSSCSPTSGRVEVCNSEYGQNGWLGIASIWATRGKNNHITQGVVKLNDTYFNMSAYNSDAWRLFVMCQEVGHEFGLDHQDENFSNTNLGTCMDYTNDPDGTIYDQLDNQKPNTHDYDEMIDIYAHLNSPDSGDGGPGNGNGKKPKKVRTNIDLNDPSAWGRAVKQDAQGKNSVYVRELDNGQTLITHVLWAQ